MQEHQIKEVLASCGISPSRPRIAILGYIREHCTHPTAEEIYLSLKPEMPAISLATVYRNLAQLETDGRIIRVGSGGTARYDGNISPHYHLSCLKCGGVVDIFMDDDCGICEKAAKIFEGTIISHSVLFTGYCSDCSKKLG